MVSRVNKERIRWIQLAIADNLCAPASELMMMSRAEMYEPRRVMINYSQAWAMIYYIMESGRHYKPALDAYFKALRKGLDSSDAYAATWGKVNMTRFDKDWKTFIMSVKG